MNKPVSVEQLIGILYEDAVVLLKRANARWRVTKRDGRYAIVTRDFRPDRYNLEVDGGKVAKVTFG